MRLRFPVSKGTSRDLVDSRHFASDNVLDYQVLRLVGPRADDDSDLDCQLRLSAAGGRQPRSAAQFPKTASFGIYSVLTKTRIEGAFIL